jgi:tetratricopeptide (TPR) repeat protein
VIAKLEAKLKADPENAEGWRMLGWSYFQTERYAEAATALKKATRLDPDHAETFSFLGEALVLASDSEGGSPDAQAAFDRALQLDPKDARAVFQGGGDGPFGPAPPRDRHVVRPAGGYPVRRALCRRYPRRDPQRGAEVQDRRGQAAGRPASRRRPPAWLPTVRKRRPPAFPARRATK